MTGGRRPGAGRPRVKTENRIIQKNVGLYQWQWDKFTAWCISRGLKKPAGMKLLMTELPDYRGKFFSASEKTTK